MPPVLLLKVADLIVKLFQIVLERHDFVFGGTNRVLKTLYIFIALPDDLLLVPDAHLRCLNIRFDVQDRVARSFV